MDSGIDGVVARERVSGRELELVEILVHLQDGVDRAFFRAGHVAGDIHHAAQILVIDAVLDGIVFDGDQFAQRHHRAVRARQVNVLKRLLGGAVGAVKFNDGRHGLARSLDRAAGRLAVPDVASASACATSATAMPCCAAFTSSTRIASRG